MGVDHSMPPAPYPYQTGLKRMLTSYNLLQLLMLATGFVLLKDFEEEFTMKEKLGLTMIAMAGFGIAYDFFRLF
jgi:cytochrome b subunit of formate dehydrogenase